MIILDSLGVGGLPDAEKYGDIGVNTLNNIAKHVDRFDIPNLIQLGIGNLEGISHVPGTEASRGAFGRAMEVSNGKDTTMGHWEIAGLNISEPFNTYPNGFPDAIIKPFEEKTGRKVVCNLPGSGTDVIDQYGPDHMKTGDLIVYTSADSVFQIAAHEEVVPLDELYKACEIALITPLRDGMNLVAKEYCACSVDNNGVLILSEFAGAADQLGKKALLVNPYDIDKTADTIHLAYCMTPEERQQRMRWLRSHVHRNDVYRWVKSIFSSLKINRKGFNISWRSALASSPLRPSFTWIWSLCLRGTSRLAFLPFTKISAASP